MIDCEIKNGWAEFLEFVQGRCSKAEFENWLAPIRLLSSTPEEISLEVPNIFVQEYLLDNYGAVLRDFVPVKSDDELSIVFKIAAPQEKKTAQVSLPEQEQPTASELLLNPHYRFETFIEGASNQFVKSAAMGVASKPGKTYNPLFIHGGVGLGKTHLLHGIGHYLKEHHKKLKVQAITTEAFINDIVDALRSKSIDRMKRYYRTLDVLLVDDIQFLQNRLNFEEEFCNTFEALINLNRQIVITSDKPPTDLKLSERMIARMEWGLVTQMEVPDLETRVAIIRSKAESKGLSLSHQAAFFIAEHIYHNVRQLEGAINRLSAYARFEKTSLLGIEAIERVLGATIEAKPLKKKINVEAILQGVSALFEVRLSDLKSESRKQTIARARQVAMYLAKELIDDSLMKIADSFGGKTHSTLLHAWKKISEEIQGNDQLRRQIDLLRRNLS